MKVLIADDEPISLLMLEKTVRKCDLEPVIARDGLEAMEVLRADEAPKLAILDWLMPGLSGVEVCRKIREIQPPLAIYLILLTAKAEKSDIIVGLGAGADDYVVKPFDSEELRARIKVGCRILDLEHGLAERVKDLQVAQAKLEDSNRDLEQFAYVASHDLQEPLRKIRAFGDRLKSRSDRQLDDTSRQYLDKMQDAAERMQSLINGVLAFSRVSTTQDPHVAVDLAVLMREVVSDLEARIDQEKATVEIGDLPVVAAAPLQMRQLFQNLIGNALKYHKPDRPPVVRIYCDAVSEGVPKPVHCISVEDNGIGVDEKYQLQIFAPFKRLHGRDKYDGTGIGLSVCKRIVERHGGTISVESQPGIGSKFTVRLSGYDRRRVSEAS